MCKLFINADPELLVSRTHSLRYLELQLSGDVPRDIRVPIASLDADRILAGTSGEAAAPDVVSKARH
ncbi:MAG: hypothetical protein ACQEV6_01650 [Pseudomonadota bacterium]